MAVSQLLLEIEMPIELPELQLLACEKVRRAAKMSSNVLEKFSIKIKKEISL